MTKTVIAVLVAEATASSTSAGPTVGSRPRQAYPLNHCLNKEGEK
jgi:hypothetical protein